MASDTPGPQLLLRRARPSDLDRLVEIERRAFDPRLHPQISRRQFRAHLAGGKSLLNVVELAGVVEGYSLSLLHEGRAFLRLYSIAVDPGKQGGSIGLLLYDGFEDDARARKLGLTLEVRSDSRKLRDRYLKLGYVAYDEVANYYPDGASCMKFRKPAI